MKVLMVARVFPAYHPRKGDSTGFVEKIFNCFRGSSYELPDGMIVGVENYATLFKGDEYLKAMHATGKKLHTIRAGTRFNPGDMASLRVWSDKPYRSKQIEFAQVEIKQTIPVNISFRSGEMKIMIDGNIYTNRELLAKNDGLELPDFYGWFQKPMTGQIICWGNVKY